MDTSRIFRRNRIFSYLRDEDRYLSRAPEAEFRFGFVGCGMMGREHMRNTLLEGRATVGALFDPADKSVEFALRELERSNLPHAATVHDTLEAICADDSLDALFISTPNYTHLEVMQVACASGKAIFLEKPIATTVADAAEIYRLATDCPALVQIGLQYRYKAVYRDAINEICRRQTLGQVHSVSMSEHRFPFLDKVDQWNKFNALSGGVLIEKCCHYFDLINLFAAARPARIFASGDQRVNFKSFSRDGRDADVLDQAEVTIEFDNGCLGSFSLNMFTPGSFEELVVCGDRGRLRAAEWSQMTSESQSVVELWVDDRGVSRTAHPDYPAYIKNAGHHGSTFFEHVDFVDLLMGREVATPTLEEAVWSVIVAHAAQVSIESGQPVEIQDVAPDGF